ncbi:MAG: phenylalanine--tRNA ligase subunit beta [Pseudomonadota bacterium]
MKFSFSWLKRHLITDLSLQDIATRLTQIGLEVEEIEDPRARLAAFVAGKVIECRSHPNADRLRVCTVDDGQKHWPVVCGAPNARKGMVGVFARAGSVIPVTGEVLKAAKIRGQDSRGMLCSSYEMGVDENHDTIIELPQGTAPGTPYSEIAGLDDPILTVAITPNRGDWACVHGIARDLAAARAGTLRPLSLTSPSPTGSPSVTVRLDFPEIDSPIDPSPCRFFALACVRGVRNGQSPPEIRRLLESAGLRPLSCLVDVTNFFTLDRARPLHVFDADKVCGDIVLRLAKDGERFDGLDGKSYTLEAGMTVICDDNGIISLAGIMGGMSTRCDENTTDVLVEAAVFDPRRTAVTGRKLMILSDARYRFERGIDEVATVPGLKQACAMITDLCGGQVESFFEVGDHAPPAGTIDLPEGFIKKMSAVPVPLDRQAEILTDLGFTVSKNGKDKNGSGLSAQPPTWRHDQDQPMDLVEEILRIHGYEAVPVLPVQATARPSAHPDSRRDARVRLALAMRGLNETVAYSFMAEDQAAHLAPIDPRLRLANPLGEGSYMRPTAAAHLLAGCARNLARGASQVALFEIGPAYHGLAPEDQETQAVIVRCGEATGRHWLATARAVDLFDMKADALAGLEAAGVARHSVQFHDLSNDDPNAGLYHPGQRGAWVQGPRVLARFGMAHPAVAAGCGLEAPAGLCEILLDTLTPRARKGFAPYRPSSLQPVARDYAFIVPTAVVIEDLLRCVRAALKPTKDLTIDLAIESIAVFDIYEGAPLADGEKSVALTVTYQPTHQALTESQLQNLEQAISSRAHKDLGARLRDGGR